ncbi:MAG: carbamoyltransferase HypF [Nitrospirae bacterium]|nr:carbamoyltransferase HypF [Nitrospirota bacterium]
MVERAKITVRGIVQGVGFRPYVYTLADSLNLRGYVTNTSDGVSIDVEGEHLSDFISRLTVEAPDLSRIFEVSVSPLPACGYTDFRIVESTDEGSFTLISPDVSVCDDCLRELFDRGDRRYLYPFINCTRCGPRFSITKSVPYDRPNTTMSVFRMCPECNKEYHDPRDRRFHAQPNACPECGPQTALRVTRDELRVTQGGSAIEETINLLKRGAIIAVKGLGGFHIACDATNSEAVKRLRERKRKSNKPFGLMAPDLETVRKFCEVSEEEEKLLLSGRRPIVLLRKRGDTKGLLPEEVAPQNQYLGFMLPYTPLHYLLFYHPSPDITPPAPPLSKGGDRSRRGSHFDALVMTSGNLSEEPIVRDNDEAVEKLKGIVDAVLLHNRDIFMRVDDSVVRVIKNRKASGVKREELMKNSKPNTHHSSLSFIRRSRGYAPEPIAQHDDGPDVMGCGADLKNTFTVTRGKFAIPSQHIGDMENYETLRFFEESLDNIKKVYRAEPVAIAHDLHPGYLSTQWALKQGARGGGQGVRTFGIQHHYAHIGSVMAEHGLSGKVIGVAFDGTGYGMDGNLWGGEFMVADIHGFERTGHFKYIPLPGGEMAIREPWRTAVSYIVDAQGEGSFQKIESLGFHRKFGADVIEKIIKLIPVREFSPLSSGAGRLFDAVSALLGLCDRNTFEGEAAIALESLVIEGMEEEYPVDIKLDIAEKKGMLVDFSYSVTGMVEDFLRDVDRRIIATKFHNTISGVIVRMAKAIAETYGVNDVALSGGTFQNLYLLERTVRMLTLEGLNVYTNEKVPCNDAGISLGQAYLCRERVKDRKKK